VRPFIAAAFSGLIAASVTPADRRRSPSPRRPAVALVARHQSYPS